MFEIIKSLRPYFFSLREIKTNISLDIKIPSHWKYEKVVGLYKSLQAKVQDKSDKDLLISIIGGATQEGYNTAFECVSEIIKLNLEEEEKRRLYNEKVAELKQIFESSSLDTLQTLNFKPIQEKDEEEGIRMVGEPDEEGPIGDREPQEESN